MNLIGDLAGKWDRSIGLKNKVIDIEVSEKATADWTIEGPRKIEDTSVISSNHYEMAHPLPVIEKNEVLIEANKKMFHKKIK